jgi:DUF1365 family protein
MAMHSAIYRGTLRHRRFHPKRHEFSYQSTLFYIDLDELPQLFDGVRGWSLESRNLARFCRADYLGDPAVPLKQAVQQEVGRQLGDCPNGPVRMLTNLRIWGFCFNPVTFYYLFDAQAQHPRVILAQVNNTPWNQRHCYALVCDPVTGKVNTAFDKQFHVSPFNPLGMRYRWVSTSPGDQLVVHMENHAAPLTATRDRPENPEAVSESITHMDATLTLAREPWTSGSLQKVLWAQPWLAIKVPVAIYWQALKLLIKGAPVYSHSAAPTASSSATRSPTTTAEEAQLNRAGDIS